MISVRHPFLRPLARRVVTSSVVAGWALLELISGNPGWALFFGAVAIFLIYEFFVAFDPANYEDPHG